MKAIVRPALLVAVLALLLPITALAADGESPEMHLSAISQSESELPPLAATPAADLETDPLLAWLAPPEWTADEATTSFGNCPGQPVPSCQCGPGLGEPGSEACCYCNQCWDGYVLALCGLDP